MKNSQEERLKQWTAHIWVGSELGAWLRILSQGRGRFSWPFAFHLPLATVITAGHSLLRYAQHHYYRGRVRETRLSQDPVFILGHWRTGTTLLHELMIQDREFIYPTTYQCFSPADFLLTQGYADRLLWWLLPKNRIIDNMDVAWDRPQEDEFALTLLGAPSPYAQLCFPNTIEYDYRALDVDTLPKSDQKRWEQTLYRFLQSVAFEQPEKRIVLKSPTHTCRIPVLLKMFPRAKFVFIKRNPYPVYLSTMNLWKTLMTKQAFQRPRFDGLQEQVLKTYVHMHERYRATRELIPAGNLIEIKYEELTQSPQDTMRAIYKHLDLGPYERAAPGVEAYWQAKKQYEKNKWELTPEVLATINERWGAAIESQGYELRRE